MPVVTACPHSVRPRASGDPVLTARAMTTGCPVFTGHDNREVVPDALRLLHPELVHARECIGILRFDLVPAIEIGQ